LFRYNTNSNNSTQHKNGPCYRIANYHGENQTKGLKKKMHSCAAPPIYVDLTAYDKKLFTAKPYSNVDEDKHAQILDNATATNYRHPEVKVETSNAPLFYRNYFYSYRSEYTIKEEEKDHMHVLTNCFS